ncbi:MAG TPA: hypothetical protein VJH20_05650 [Candidatus Nanoarchaeia archaeon]|nr:hypothetical protein [Candidatus Nanoarchaeia archaeon]
MRNVLEKYIGNWMYLDSNEDVGTGGYCYVNYVGKLVDTDHDFLEFAPFMCISRRHFTGPQYLEVVEKIKGYEQKGDKGFFSHSDLEGKIISREIVRDIKKIDIDNIRIEKSD